MRQSEEILTLAKQNVPRYEIAKRIGSTWPLVSETLERAAYRPVTSASTELALWASTLLPLISQIRQARPDTDPILGKVDKLEKELLGITDAVFVEQGKLPWRGIEADKERWRLGQTNYHARTALDLMDALKGCIKALGVEKLPRLLEQAETCISNISRITEAELSEMAKA